MFLSIVIPIYNAAGSVGRCLDSIWSQGLPEGDFEVICVDDGSSDGSSEVIKSIGKSHENLRLLLNPTNLRAGGARNHGVREARGEYVLFIDADDYFHPDSLKEAFEYQKQKRLDILMCDFARHTEQCPNNTLVHNFPYRQIMSGREFMVKNSLPFAPWKYIFRRSIMVDNEVFFAERVSCEDVDWTHKIAFFADTMQYCPLLLTHYILSETSQTGSEFRNYQTVFHRLLAGKRISELTALCATKEEVNHINRVAQSTLQNGVMFLNALAVNPALKVNIIKECIDSEGQWSGIVKFAAQHPYIYSWGSTLIAPLFKSLVVIKRKFLGRK